MEAVEERKTALDGKWTVVQVPAEDLPSFWAQIEEALDFAPEIWNQLDTKQNIFYALRNGYSQCWVIFRGDEALTCAFTRLLEFPSGVRVVRMWGMVGELDDSLPVIGDALRQYCVRQGATKFEVEGRFGWERLLKPFGMKRDRVILSTDVRERMH